MTDNKRRFEVEYPCFIYGNHSHNYDPFLLNVFAPWRKTTDGVLTREYFRSPFVSKHLGQMGIVPTRKHVPEPALIRTLFEKVKHDRSIVIYPEGGRRWAGRPMPWIESTAKLFIKMGVPIYPVITEGSYVGWPRWADYPRRSRIRIRFEDPIRLDRKMPFEEALKILRAPIDIDENIVPEEIRPKRAYRPASGIQRLLYRDPDTGEIGGIYTPDGTYVVNKAGTIRWKMLPDSTLLDEATDTLYTTGDLYEKVKNFPLETDKDGILIKNRVEVHEEMEYPNLVSRGSFEATLYNDHLTLKNSQTQQTISLEEIRFTGIERNCKLQLYFNPDQLIQLNFNQDGSALQWENTVKTLKAVHNTPAS